MHVRGVVIGGGPAGVAAALEAALAGATITLVEASHLGGRATWHSLVPSKVFLSAAESLHRLAESPAAGALASPRPHLATLRQRIHALAEAQSQAYLQALQQAGVTVRLGVAAFESTHRLRLETNKGEVEFIDFDFAILATGSEPVFLPTLKPDGQRLIAPRHLSYLDTWPEHLIVIGGGVTGSEMASCFSQFGVRVSWVTDLPTFLPRMDDDVAEALAGALAERGVALYPNAPVEKGESLPEGVRVHLRDGRVLEGSHAFIAIGRRADTARLNLDAIGLQATPAGIPVDDYGRSAQSHIYVVGDLAGPPYSVNRAIAQARTAARHALGLAATPLREGSWVEAVYSDPQVAQVGLNESTAQAQGRAVKVYRVGYDQALKAHLEGQPRGLVKVLVEVESGKVVGGAAVGSHAAEIVNALSLAVLSGQTLEDLARWSPAYPTLSELIPMAVRGYGL